MTSRVAGPSSWAAPIRSVTSWIVLRSSTILSGSDTVRSTARADRLPVTVAKSTVAKADSVDSGLRPQVPEPGGRRRVAGDEEHRTVVAGDVHGRCRAPASTCRPMAVRKRRRASPVSARRGSRRGPVARPHLVAEAGEPVLDHFDHVPNDGGHRTYRFVDHSVAVTVSTIQLILNAAADASVEMGCHGVSGRVQPRRAGRLAPSRMVSTTGLPNTPPRRELAQIEDVRIAGVTGAAGQEPDLDDLFGLRQLRLVPHDRSELTGQELPWRGGAPDLDRTRFVCPVKRTTGGTATTPPGEFSRSR